MDPIKVDFGSRDKKSSTEIVIPPEKSVLKVIISIILSAVFAGVLYYFMLPSLNFKDYSFYAYVGLVIVSFIVFLFLLSKAFAKPEYMPYIKRKATVPVILAGVLAVTVAVGFLVSCVFFRAKSYSNLIDMTEVTDEEEIGSQLSDGSSLSKVSKLDTAAAEVIADKKLTDLKDLGKVSQYDVSLISSQINLNVEHLANSSVNGEESPVRVFSLKYQNIIKWLYNRKDGLPGYVVVDTSDSKSYFFEVKGGIKYSLTDYFSANVKRHITFAHPTYIYDTPSFEIDDEGTPWWVCPVLDKRIGLFGGRDVIGVVLVNAQTGDCYDYSISEITSGKVSDNSTGRPLSVSWIDHVYSDDLLLEQVNYKGKYTKGFWNSILNQDGCYAATDGHNYLAYDGDMWLYSGISSLSLNDNSIINFVMINQRTKETMMYAASGGTEAAAQKSAEGLVTNYKYVSSFPVLVNINGVPTYFMSLKDDSTNYIKGFAMVSVADFNDITAYALTNESSFVGAYEECKKNYIEILDKEGKGTTVDKEDVGSNENNGSDKAQTAVGKITEIRSAVIGGNTHYYVKLDSVSSYFAISASDSSDAIIANTGDTVTVVFDKADAENKIINATTLTLGEAE